MAKALFITVIDLKRKSIIDGNTEELDTNSFIKVTNKEIIVPTPVGPLVIPPGILNSVGKML